MKTRVRSTPLHPNYNEPLPHSPGPKLHSFCDRNASIDFQRLLSNPDTAAQSHVFEVSIASKPYALKMFKYYNDEEDLAAFPNSEIGLVSIDLLHAHMDPFYNECRAFGRIIEAGLNGKIAVRCYGYITIPAAREEELEQRFHVSAWDRPGKEDAKPVAQRRPLRAIVKGLLSDDDAPLTAKAVTKILRDLKRMRRLGVYPMDVQARNYKGGLLVDMGVAITAPHFLFDIKPAWQVRFLKREDLVKWEKMVREAGVVVGVRALRNREFCAKLRSAGKEVKAVK